MNPTPEQRKLVKGQGFLSNKDQVHFSARVITGNGVLDSRQVKLLGEAAERYGNGKVSFTTRLTVELPGIRFEEIPAFQAFIARENLVTGGTGAKVRPVVACKGTVCVFGNIDTQGLATEIHTRFFEGYSKVALPHKFKIAVGGCPNNCVKPDLNDVGMIGQRVPAYDSSLCRGCAVCSTRRACPMKAWVEKDGIMAIDASLCNNCGICIGKCPFHAVPDGVVAYRMTIGGRWGKQIRIGSALSRVFDKADALDMLEKVILFYKAQGMPGERLASVIDRLGMAETERHLFSDDLLLRKAEILGHQTGDSARC